MPGTYEGALSTRRGPMANEEELKAMAEKIRKEMK